MGSDQGSGMGYALKLPPDWQYCHDDHRDLDSVHILIYKDQAHCILKTRHTVTTLFRFGYSLNSAAMRLLRLQDR